MQIERLYNANTFAPLDWSLARTIQRVGECDDPWVGLAAALVSRSANQGNVCLDLAIAHERGAGEIDIESKGPLAIPLDDWLQRLNGCPAVGVPGDFCPLILDGERLYFHRYWHYEKELAGLLLQRAGCHVDFSDPENLEQQLKQLFDGTDGDQIEAARKAAMQRFTVISGGPGTGKTYTVAKIILLLLSLHKDRPLKIHLAAPTGKAAARLQESIESALDNFRQSSIDAKIPMPSAHTLHRLLGYMPSRSHFRYGAERQLPTDAVIVDEASMIDLALMHQLVQAVPLGARLILVGDKDQLASVEAGAVLGDICYGIAEGYKIKRPPNQGSGKRAVQQSDEAGKPTLQPHIQVLERSYRFDARSGLGALSRAINAGDDQRVVSLLSEDEENGLSLVSPSDKRTLDTLLDTLIDQAVDRYLGDYFASTSPEQAFFLVNRFRILSALRRGPYGAESLNRMVEQSLQRHGLISFGPMSDSTWYRGRPLMVTRNDYNHGLFNGDTGIVTGPINGSRDQMQVLFPVHEGHFRQLAPHQLPEQQTVYAMTVHKSQGSEFDHVMVILPDQDTPLLTRELIYTAVTRARKSLVILAKPDLLIMAIKRGIRRSSGLRDALWGKADRV